MSTQDLESKAIIEAALFAAGRILSSKELAALLSLSEERVEAIAGDLAAEYSRSDSGIEIKRIGDGYVMQVRFGLGQEVLSIAPREIEAPLIRTLAIIAYRQPIRQSELVEVRGNKSYAHVKELEKRGLINATKQGRTKLLTTTKAFADYFGLASERPEAIRKAILRDKKLIGVTPMYKSLALRLGLDFLVVNPYRPEADDLEHLKEIDLLVLAPGYSERVREHFQGEMLEASVRTLSQLKESAERICVAAGSGEIEPLAAEIDALLQRYREQAHSARPIRPLTPMIEEIARDLRISVQNDGLTALPDYIEAEAEIKVPTHQPYDMDIMERIVQRYEKILEMAH